MGTAQRSHSVLGKARGSTSFSPAMSDAHNYMAWVLSPFTQDLKGRILEVGLGHGSYFPALRGYGSYCGLDIDPDLVDAARARYPKGEFHQVDLTDVDFTQRMGASRFDAIVCLNVLEHIDNDGRALKNLMRVLTPRGRLCILVPALPFLYNDMDRLAGHYRRYTLGGLADLAAEAGADIEELRYFNALGGLGWLANRLLRHQSLADRSVDGQVAFFDRYLVPLARRVDPLFHRFFGQSAICRLTPRGSV